MVTEPEFRAVAQRVRNWSRWGAADELGTLNLITCTKVAEAARLVKRGSVFPLGYSFDENGVWSGSTFRRNPIHLMTLDGGDDGYLSEQMRDDTFNVGRSVSAGGWGRNLGKFNDDYIVMPLQCSTQWDALAHVYYEGQLYNGFPAASVTSQGALRGSVSRVAEHGVVSRGVLIDVPRHRHLDCLPANEAIEADELDAILSSHGMELSAGDIVLLRTGWLSTFREMVDPETWRLGCPGLSWRVALWLHEHDVAAVAADNLGVEAAGQRGESDVGLALHLLTLRDMGLLLGEIWDLEALARDCADDGIYEFLLVAPPLNVTGAVGSPLNPVAIK